MKNIYKEITDQIVQALENGVRPWHQPWNADHPPDASRARCAGMAFPIRASMS
jgi:antirestriction protein ArdC